jgi:hypothetical protein
MRLVLGQEHRTPADPAWTRNRLEEAKMNGNCTSFAVPQCVDLFSV